MASSILADNGVSSGSAGIKTTADSTGALALQTTTAGGTATTAVTIDTSQNVGIGQTPTSYGATVRNVEAYIAGASGFTLVSANTASVKTEISSGESSLLGQVGTRTNHPLALKTNDTERMRIDSSGNVGIGTSSPDTGVHLRVFGNAYYTAQYGTGNKARYGADATGAFIEAVGAIPIAFYTNSTSRASIDSSGRFMLNTASSGGWSGDAAFSSAATSGTLGWGVSAYNNTAVNGGAFLARVDNTTRQLLSMYYTTTNVGNITTNGSVVTYGGTSDYRLKENVQPMTGALAKVALLKPCTFTWKNSGIEDDGFIAHELQEVHPNAVVGEKDAVNEDGSIKAQEIDPRFLIATLTAAIQEQQALITTLTERITALEAK